MIKIARKPITRETFDRIMDAAIDEAQALDYYELQERCIVMDQRRKRTPMARNTVDDAIILGYVATWTERYHTEILPALNT